MYCFFVDAAINADQFEMLLNDPRVESAEPSVKEELRQFIEATKKHGGLLSPRQVAAIANVSYPTIFRHIKAGRFTTYRFVDTTLLPLDEVRIYIQARTETAFSKGGRGLKAPKFKDLMKVE